MLQTIRNLKLSLTILNVSYIERVLDTEDITSKDSEHLFVSLINRTSYADTAFINLIN